MGMELDSNLCHSSRIIFSTLPLKADEALYRKKLSSYFSVNPGICVFISTLTQWITARVLILHFIGEILQREAGVLPPYLTPPPLVRATGTRKVSE